MDKKRNEFACAVIADLGGPAATARIFKIKSPSVIGWMSQGIPPARMMYLEVAYPEVVNRANEIAGIDASDDVQPPVGTPKRPKKRK